MRDYDDALKRWLSRQQDGSSSVSDEDQGRGTGGTNTHAADLTRGAMPWGGLILLVVAATGVLLQPASDEPPNRPSAHAETASEARPATGFGDRGSFVERLAILQQLAPYLRNRDTWDALPPDELAALVLRNTRRDAPALGAEEGAQASPLDALPATPVLDRVVVTSPYGWREGVGSDTTRSFHHGVDLRAALGTPVYAAGQGVVTEAGPSPSFGLHVRIRHAGTPYESILAHLSAVRPGIRTGVAVAAGEEIGRSGESGHSVGPHLHLEIRDVETGRSVPPQAVIGEYLHLIDALAGRTGPRAGNPRGE